MNTKNRDEKKVEMVERKGIGHPDSIADGISEAVSRALSKEYRKKLGFIAHHNTDEVQIIGGKSSPEFGGGNIEKKIYILLGGRATKEYSGKEIDVDTIAVSAAKRYLDHTIKNLDVDNHIEIESKIGEGSPDLTEMYSRNDKIPLANDTSFGVGYYPYTETENLVKEIEDYLNSDTTKKDMPWIGEDIKVMAYRNKDELNITVAAAFVSSEVESLEDYIDKKNITVSRIKKLVGDLYNGDFDVGLNTADHPENGSVYITVTGTSAEMGDDGSTGRGNRTNGLITPFNPMSLEATSGKNPVAHVGKIYNILSVFIARKIVENIEEVESATVKILSQIGRPVDDPQLLNVEIGEDEYSEDILENVEAICYKWINRIPEVMDKVLEGELKTF